MRIQKKIFGILSNGKKAMLYTIKTKHLKISITNYGCTITALYVPDKNGALQDIVLGWSDLSGYITDTHTYFGAVIGQYANRIAKSRFTLEQKEYSLDKNNGENCLHGGFMGFDKMIWSTKIEKLKNAIALIFTRTILQEEQGFPHNLDVSIKYIVTKNNELFLEYSANPKHKTPINITNHTYFNLTGNPRLGITDHICKIYADTYLPVDKKLIPTGEKKAVKTTAFDFNTEKAIGKDIKETGTGYDHCYCITESMSPLIHPLFQNTALNPCASVFEPKSKRIMEVFTNQPGVQFYTGNFLDILGGKHGAYQKHAGFCLETQAYPNSVNIQDFPNTIYDKQHPYYSLSLFRFGIKKEGIQ